METLKNSAVRIISLCQILLLHPLTDTQSSDVQNIKQGAETFIRLLDDLHVTEEQVNQLRAAQHFDKIGYISHEIRAPLNIIIGYSEMLLEMVESLTQPQHDDLIRILQISDELEAAIYELFDKDRCG